MYFIQDNKLKSSDFFNHSVYDQKHTWALKNTEFWVECWMSHPNPNPNPNPGTQFLLGTLNFLLARNYTSETLFYLFFMQKLSVLNKNWVGVHKKLGVWAWV